ncbi:MAG: hypothetical protein AB7F20_02560 [Geoalkalibacter sp.]|uniref:hypothetical protein n=1 Tax=Geoalkalibacter sp. TaxID=3041440 RepID=UPI003D0AFF59
MVESIFPSPSKQIDKKAAPEKPGGKKTVFDFSNAGAKNSATYQMQHATSGKTLFSNHFKDQKKIIHKISL